MPKLPTPEGNEQLSKRERQIMALFYQHGPLSARQIVELLPDAPANATVRTLLRILEEKGHLSHTKAGRQFIYHSQQTPEDIRPGKLRNLLQTFFKGSVSEAVLTFLNDPEAEVSSTELDELSRLISEARDERK